MSVKYLVFALVIGLFGCSGQKGKTGSSTEQRDMNLLFIVVDDLNLTLGCYGHPVVQTPHIDRLATSGIQFNHAYCNQLRCSLSATENAIQGFGNARGNYRC